MKKIFVDAGAFIALNSPRDEHFSKAQILLQKTHRPTIHLITTEHIISETATHLLTTLKGGYHHAARYLEKMFLPSSPFHITWINKKRFMIAQRIFSQYNKDKFWSFTDCASYVVMKELKINTVFTFDEHFEQMGFSLLS